MNSSRRKLSELMKVTVIGAERPVDPCKNPPTAPTGTTSRFAKFQFSDHFGFFSRKVTNIKIRTATVFIRANPLKRANTNVPNPAPIMPRIANFHANASAGLCFRNRQVCYAFDRMFGTKNTATANGTSTRSAMVGIATNGAPIPVAPLKIPPTIKVKQTRARYSTGMVSSPNFHCK